jgi:hypothetical protein
LRRFGPEVLEARFDIIGLNALYGDAIGVCAVRDPFEVRIRVAARAKTMADAVYISNEVESLLCAGPAGGGGSMKNARQVVAVASTFIPRSFASPTVTYAEA